MRVEPLGDFAVSVVVEELIDQRYDLGGVVICRAEDLGFSVVIVSVLQPLKRGLPYIEPILRATWW